MYFAELICFFMPFVTATVFVAGIGCAIRRWNRGGVAKIPLFPRPATPYGKWKRILVETLTCRELSRGNRSLWIGTWFFHLFLFLVLLGHTRIVTDFPLLWRTLGLTNDRADQFGAAIGGAAGLILLTTAIYILMRRFTMLRVREISGFEDFASILLILAVVISGDLMRFGSHLDLARSREFISGLCGLRPTAIPRDPWFLLHFFLAQALIMYIPFSKFLHIPGVFYCKSALTEG